METLTSSSHLHLFFFVLFFFKGVLVDHFKQILPLSELVQFHKTFLVSRRCMPVLQGFASSRTGVYKTPTYLGPVASVLFARSELLPFQMQ